MTGPVCTLLSVVVIGRNEGERLQRCLESVFRMHRGDWAVEVIYVDSASTDSSVALAQSMGARTTVLDAQRSTAARGRNAGWRMATGEIILFLDGDTVLAEDFALRGLQSFDTPSIAVVWGHRREMYPERSIYNRAMDLDWVYAPGLVEFCGGDALFRREALVLVDGFDETLIAGEEPELCRRLRAQGLQILHIDEPMTKHDLAVFHFKQYWLRAVRAGHAYAELAQRFANTADPFWSSDAKRGRNRAITLMLAPCIGLLASLLLRSWWPLVLVLLAIAALVLRTTWKARWKSNNTYTLLVYGVHSLLQQIPIYLGQRRFQQAHRRGAKMGLLEYK